MQFDDEQDTPDSSLICGKSLPHSRFEPCGRDVRLVRPGPDDSYARGLTLFFLVHHGVMHLESDGSCEGPPQ